MLPGMDGDNYSTKCEYKRAAGREAEQLRPSVATPGEGFTLRLGSLSSGSQPITFHDMDHSWIAMII